MLPRLVALRSRLVAALGPLRPPVQWLRIARKVRRARRAAARDGQLLVHAIGDSHTAAFRDTSPFVVHHLGPTTAFNLASTTSATGSREGLRRALRWVRPDERVLLVFGEIDCRVHVHDQVERRQGAVDHRGVVEEVVAAYVPVVRQVAAAHRLAVMGVTPASEQREFFGLPSGAPDTTRIMINRTFNEVLAAALDEAGIPMVDVSAMAVDDRGFLSPRFSDDRLHYSVAVLPAVRARLAEVFDGAAVAPGSAKRT